MSERALCIPYDRHNGTLLQYDGVLFFVLLPCDSEEVTSYKAWVTEKVRVRRVERVEMLQGFCERSSIP